LDIVSLHPLGGGAEHKRKEMKNYAGSENQVIIRKDLLSILKELLKDLPIFLCSSLRTSVSYFAAL